MTNEQKIYRGERAKELLNNELVVEAFAKLEESYFKAWKNAKTTEDRENLHRYMVNLAGLKGQLMSVMTSGELTKREVVELEGRRGFWPIRAA